ncbi:N4 gp55-like protein [Roseovarius sp. 217 phage 1]|uniref:N4 gp55-like protein n=1 Tax=Roseovarius sp. 217 phage 1 TaxID=874471 RepID=E3PZB0_9CAUD|nr:N4 gp55-like protein [Roseovarius sp. 217 phage 1]
MDDITNKTPEELLVIVENTDDKEVLRYIANELEVSFSGNTGVGTLKEKLIPVLQAKAEAPEDEDLDMEDPVMKALAAKQAEPTGPVKTEPKKILDMPRTAQALMDPHAKGLSDVERRAIVRARAMKLIRCRVHNLDPNDSALEGVIKTAYNKFTGKVSKYIPFGDENEHGWHVPQILLNVLREEKYTMRKESKVRGQVSSFGVKQYKTIQMPKYNIEILPDLSLEELQGLAQDQKARGAIDIAA